MEKPTEAIPPVPPPPPATPPVLGYSGPGSFEPDRGFLARILLGVLSALLAIGFGAMALVGLFAVAQKHSLLTHSGLIVWTLGSSFATVIFVMIARSYFKAPLGQVVETNVRSDEEQSPVPPTEEIGELLPQDGEESTGTNDGWQSPAEETIDPAQTRTRPTRLEGRSVDTSGRPVEPKNYS